MGKSSFLKTLKHSQKAQWEGGRIRMVTDTDIPHLIALANAALGKGYLTYDTFEWPNVRRYWRAAIHETAGFVGFCYTYHVSAAEAADLLALEKSALPERVGILKSIAVHTVHQGKGIGYSLVQDAQRWLLSEAISVIFCVVWQSKQGANLAGIMESHGFLLYKSIPQYWCQESQLEGYLCPECGTPCQCTALIYQYKAL